LVGAPAATGSATTPAIDAAAMPAAKCPDPADYCATAHPGSALTGFCIYGDCFEMRDGDEMRIHAAGPQDYPRKWFIWHDGELAPAGTRPCRVTRSGNKDRVELSDSPNCRVDLQTAHHLYHEHIVGNPIAMCVGWVECKAY
jgi:hypothetical protein